MSGLRDPQGKAALFSGAPLSAGRWVVECSDCEAITRLDTLGLLRGVLPLSVTIPLRRHTTWMRCPACGRQRWVKISLR
ncbi:MAG TPA: hypothetical protein VI541_02200 [Actinomycetota bacterium]|nr:hypothetical protein [Actinomycetota bacterium]